MIKILLQPMTYTQRTYNNRYTIVRCTSTRTGKSVDIDDGYGGGDNVRYALNKLGFNWNEVHETQPFIIDTNREHEQRRKSCDAVNAEHMLKLLKIRKPRK